MNDSFCCRSQKASNPTLPEGSLLSFLMVDGEMYRYGKCYKLMDVEFVCSVLARLAGRLCSPKHLNLTIITTQDT